MPLPRRAASWDGLLVVCMRQSGVRLHSMPEPRPFPNASRVDRRQWLMSTSSPRPRRFAPPAPMLKSLFRFATVFIAACAIHTGAAAQNSLTNANGNGPVTAVVQTEQVRAELLAHAPQGIDPGKTVWVGLQLTHQPHWHTYWKNPGDSGLPTTLDWKLPAGVQAGAISWPAPEKIAIGSLANFGYEGTVLLAVPLTIGPDFRGNGVLGDLEVRLNASWLVCRQECIPQDGDFVLRISARGSTAMHGAAFDATLASAPKAHTGAMSARIAQRRNSLTVAVVSRPACRHGNGHALHGASPRRSECCGVPSAFASGKDSECPDRCSGPKARHTGMERMASGPGVLPLSAQRECQRPANLPVVLALPCEKPECRCHHQWRLAGHWRQRMPTAQPCSSVGAAATAPAQRHGALTSNHVR